ncbi:MAG: hypothetical protein U0790_14895 [Isosphaeraceae bacterium]
MRRRLRTALAPASCLLIFQGASACASARLTITAKYDGTENDLRKSLVDDAIKEWTACIQGPSGQDVVLTITFTFKDLGDPDIGGGTDSIKADANGNP